MNTHSSNTAYVSTLDRYSLSAGEDSEDGGRSVVVQGVVQPDNGANITNRKIIVGRVLWSFTRFSCVPVSLDWLKPL